MKVALRRSLWVLLGLAIAAAVILSLPVTQWRTGRLPVPALPLEPGSRFAETAQRLWIDTDAACGESRRTDPDDCFAILVLANASGVTLAGISTVFGNASLEVTDRIVAALLEAMSGSNGQPAVHSGSFAPLQPDGAIDEPAHRALREALTRGPLTIVALGPLTNIAAALRARPELQQRVTRIIAVMGRRPGHLFHPTEGAPGAILFGHGPIFSDLNFVSDPLAAAEILRMRVPLVLVPYDAARKIEVTRDALDGMRSQGGAPAWVADRARGWLEFWRDDVGRDGFYPFDLLAAAFALRPDMLLCTRVPIRVGEDMRVTRPLRQAPALLAGPEVLDEAHTDTTQATGSAVYCPDIAEGLRDWLASQLRTLKP